MGLIADGKVIIEVGLNEWTTKQQNPNVPYGIDEVIEAGVACAQEGASVLHFHARADDGSQQWSAAHIYRAEMEGIGARCDVIMYPSYNADFTHLWDLLDTPPEGAPMFMSPFDVFQSVGTVAWDEASRSFRAMGFDIDTMGKSKGDKPAELEEMVRRGQVPTVCTQELGDLRWTRHALEAGLISAPVALKIFVIDQFIKGTDPSPAGVDAMLSGITDDMEPMIVPALMASKERNETILRHAMRRGAHIRVGLGDNPDAFPVETNADLVRWAVELARDEGLEPATAADVRQFFGSGTGQVENGL
jgi:3-keto-5-aminohexanoate cleavage enzyme